MREWIDHGVLAGMSATMAYWLLVCSASMGMLSWRYRDRYSNWRGMTQRDRADAVLSLSLFGFLTYAMVHRVIATYAHAIQEWVVSPAMLAITPLNLVWALVSVSGLLWWTCHEIFGSACHHRWWLLFMFTGAFHGAGVSWRY